MPEHWNQGSASPWFTPLEWLIEKQLWIVAQKLNWRSTKQKASPFISIFFFPFVFSVWFFLIAACLHTPSAFSGEFSRQKCICSWLPSSQLWRSPAWIPNRKLVPAAAESWWGGTLRYDLSPTLRIQSACKSDSFTDTKCPRPFSLSRLSGSRNYLAIFSSRSSYCAYRWSFC